MSVVNGQLSVVKATKPDEEALNGQDWFRKSSQEDPCFW
jgi:hypothetical protein